MSKIAVFTISVLLVLSALVNISNSQIPYIAIYFDQELQSRVADCPFEPPGTVGTTLYIVAHDFNTDLKSVEYKIEYPWALSFGFDTIASGHTSSGTSPSGITINFSSPLNGLNPQVAQRVFIVWICELEDCYDYRIPVRVFPHPTSGRLGAVRSSDDEFIDAVGWTSIICPSISPNKGETWGRIKALYN